MRFYNLYGIKQAQVRLNWGMEDKPEFEIADVFRGFEVGGISRLEVYRGWRYIEVGGITSQELRKILIELGWPLEIQQPQTTQNSASPKL